MLEDEIARETRKKWALVIAFNARSGVLDELAVVHAGGAGGFASAAVEAFVDVIDEAGGDGHSFLRRVGDGGLLDADHLADTSARRVRLQVPEAIGGACVEAQAAMHAAGVVLVSRDETGNRSGVHRGQFMGGSHGGAGNIDWQH